jgi:hypothetical protein
VQRGAGAAELRCGNDVFRWLTPVPRLTYFIYGEASVLFALISEPDGARFHVRVMSMNGSEQSHADLDGAATGAAFVRRGGTVELDEASGSRAWIDVMTGAVELLPNARGAC